MCELIVNCPTSTLLCAVLQKELNPLQKVQKETKHLLVFSVNGPQQNVVRHFEKYF